MRASINFLCATLLAAFLLLFTGRVEAAPGVPDSLNVNVGSSNGTQSVYATAVQPDGKFIVVGRFDSVLGVPRRNVARINADGTLDKAFDPNVSGEIHTVVLQADGKILLGGAISSVRPNGAASPTYRTGIVRLNGDGSLDAGFDPKPDTHVESIAVQPDGMILLGGSFHTLQPNGEISPTTRMNIARVNEDGSLDKGFDPNANGAVNSVVLQADGKILLGGNFTTIGGPNEIARKYIARVNADGSLDAGFDPKAGGAVECIAVQPDGRILLGGRFITLQPNGAATATTRNRIARLNRDGSVDAGFNPNAADYVFSIALQADGKILLGGSFTTLQPNGAMYVTHRSRIARLNADGSLDATFDPNANSYVRSVALQGDGKILAGGAFTMVGKTMRGGLVRLQNDSATQSLFAPKPTRLLWTRGGSSPELSAVTMDKSMDGGNSWIPLGNATRVGTSGRWELITSPLPGNVRIRARGRTMGGYHSTSSGLVEQVEDITVDVVTLALTLTAPDANAIAPSSMTVSFSLPEVALPGSVTLTFSGTTTTTLTLAASQETNGAHSFSLSPANPLASPDVASGAAIPDGVYSVTLSYQDDGANPPASATRTGVIIDTTPPQISVPAAAREMVEGPLADYTGLATVADANPRTVTQSPAVGSLMTEGLQTITLTASDMAGNTGSTTFDLDVLKVHASHLATGAAAPGAGTNGIPANAIIASFNTPATDDAGNIVFVAKWTSDAKSKGTHIFRNNACIPILNSAAYKSFTDPVVDGGDVACIAGLNPSGSAVLSGSVLLQPITKTGDPAPGAGGATFRTFKAVAVRGGSLAIFAQLKAPAASDLGLWIKDGNAPLKLALREGQIIDGKTVKTLVSFMPGKDSPGQGRGWFTTAGGGGVVLALAFFTDKTQGIVTANANGETAILSKSDAPVAFSDAALSGANFASYNLPSVNESAESVFLATLKVGSGGVTKADALGIFLGDETAQFTTVARIGADFRSLSDPVLSPNSGIAFTATHNGSSARTLWWKAAGQSLNPVAQTGTAAADVPGSQWKAFSSLGITDQGPIFAATLVNGQGGVTTKTASGVWCSDASGNPRLLFRTGDTIHGKKLARFELLKATVGNAGVTRSFNNSAFVVWLATFTDKTSAIIRSKLP